MDLLEKRREQMFPKLTSQRVRVSDGEGWAAGRAAADRAALHRSEERRVGKECRL